MDVAMWATIIDIRLDVIKVITFFLRDFHFVFFIFIRKILNILTCTTVYTTTLIFPA